MAISSHADWNSAAVTSPLPSASPVGVRALSSPMLMVLLPSSSRNRKIGSKSTPVLVFRSACVPATATRRRIREGTILITILIAIRDNYIFVGDFFGLRDR